MKSGRRAKAETRRARRSQPRANAERNAAAAAAAAAAGRWWQRLEAPLPPLVSRVLPFS